MDCYITDLTFDWSDLISGNYYYRPWGNAIASVHLLPLCLSNRLTFDLDLLHAYGSWP